MFGLLKCISASVEPKHLNQILYWSIFGITVAILPESYRVFWEGTGIASWRMQGSFLLPGLLGAYLTLFLPFISANACAREKNLVKRLLWQLLWAFSFTTMLLTFTRSVILTCTAASIITGYILSKPRFKEMLIQLSICILLLVGLLWLLIPSPGWLQTHLLHRTAHLAHGDSSTYSRLTLWNAAFQITLHNPWVGIGPARFALIYPRYQQNFQFYSIAPHNWVLRLLAETGMISTAIIMYLIFSAFLSPHKELSSPEKRQETPAPSPLTTYLLQVGVASFLIVSLTDVTLYFPTLWTTAGALLGLSYIGSSSRQPPSSNNQPQRYNRSIHYLLSTFWAVMLLLNLLSLPARWKVIQGEYYQMTGKYNEAIKVLQQASKLLPGWGKPTRLALEIILQSDPSRLSPEHLTKLSSYYLHCNPTDSYAYYLYGRALLLQQKISESQQAFKKAIALDPHNHPIYYYYYALAKSKTEPVANIIGYLKATLNKFPLKDLSAAHDVHIGELKLELAKIYQFLGELYDPVTNPHQALKYLHTALLLNPNDPYIELGVGTALYHLGQKRQAALHLKKFLIQLPNYPMVRQMLRECQQLNTGTKQLHKE